MQDRPGHTAVPAGQRCDAFCLDPLFAMTF